MITSAQGCVIVTRGINRGLNYATRWPLETRMTRRKPRRGTRDATVDEGSRLRRPVQPRSCLSLVSSCCVFPAQGVMSCCGVVWFIARTLARAMIFVVRPLACGDMALVAVAGQEAGVRSVGALVGPLRLGDLPGAVAEGGY